LPFVLFLFKVHLPSYALSRPAQHYLAERVNLNEPKRSKTNRNEHQTNRNERKRSETNANEAKRSRFTALPAVIALLAASLRPMPAWILGSSPRMTMVGWRG